VAALQGVEIERDGVPVARAVWGVPVPVDPGEHRLVVRAPGKQPWEGHVTTGDTGSAVTFAIPGLVDLPPHEVVPRGAPLPPQPAPPPRRSAAPAIVLGVVAAAAAGTGVGLFLAHSSAASDAESTSSKIKSAGGTCAPGAASSLCASLASKASSADTLGNASTVAFVTAGAAAVVTVGYLLWPEPRTPNPAAALRIVPALGRGQGGLVAVGSF
jgi:hypothetical protein